MTSIVHMYATRPVAATQAAATVTAAKHANFPSSTPNDRASFRAAPSTSIATDRAYYDPPSISRPGARHVCEARL
jgi:hypothetical protein